MYDFALNLNRKLASEGNLVWSPYSVASALGLAAAGARGRTYDELERALGAAPDGLGLAEAAALADAEIAVANTLWLREGLPIEEAYERAADGFPGAAVRGADFAGDAERVRQTINAEVAKATRELIRDLLPAGSVDMYTAAVIVNALYLKVAWQHKFAERDTVPAPFHGPGGRRRVPTMRRTGHMPLRRGRRLADDHPARRWRSGRGRAARARGRRAVTGASPGAVRRGAIGQGRAVGAEVPDREPGEPRRAARRAGGHHRLHR
jgi:serpin B